MYICRVGTYAGAGPCQIRHVMDAARALQDLARTLKISCAVVARVVFLHILHLMDQHPLKSKDALTAPT